MFSKQKKTFISSILQEHFGEISYESLKIHERRFPFRVRSDLQVAIDQIIERGGGVRRFSGVFREYAHETLGFASLLYPSDHAPPIAVPPQYEEVDIGEREPVRCLKNGLWLLEREERRFALLLTPDVQHGMASGLLIQIAVASDDAGLALTERFFRSLEEAVHASRSYRGKVLSLEYRHLYSGQSTGIAVHRVRSVQRDEVILPQRTLELLERNVLRFVAQRPQLASLGMSVKKGLLFYGPPGTGKTHTIHYLAGALAGHTTLLISAEQVGLLGEYMTLARLLQPSVVVVEDADLIARERSKMGGACEELLLNKLLNEMDGLKPDAEVFFILTTNRPESLEAALTSRPGRIDQAIEFPLPDSVGRRKLLQLYSYGMDLSEQVLEAAVRKSEKVSASFIKEWMRRAAQFRLERGGDDEVRIADLDAALDEMLFRGGSLNRKLLGAAVEEDEIAGSITDEP